VYASRSGKWYHVRSHHSELLDHDCPACDEAFRTQAGMKQHHAKTHGETLSFVEKECEWCGDTFDVDENRLETEDEFTGRFCTDDCYRDWFRDERENHPAWKGGYERIDYGTTWEEKREEILERDRYECRVCGRSESMKDPLHVHHLVKVKKFDNPDDAHTRNNLITLCSSHHRLVETGRIECPEPEAIDEVDVDDVLEY